MLKFRLGSDGTVKVLLCRRALKPVRKRPRSDDGLVMPFLLLCNERMGGGGVGHKVRAGGVNSGCAAVYVARPGFRTGSSSCPTQGSSDLQSPEDFQPPQIYPSISDFAHPFAQLHLHLSRSSPFHTSPSDGALICFVQPLWGL